MSVTFKTLLDMAKLKDIKEFNMLQRNLELTKALQDVDRLKAENLALKAEVDKWKDEITKLKAERLKSKL